MDHTKGNDDTDDSVSFSFTSDDSMTEHDVAQDLDQHVVQNPCSYADQRMSASDSSSDESTSPESESSGVAAQTKGHDLGLDADPEILSPDESISSQPDLSNDTTTDEFMEDYLAGLLPAINDENNNSEINDDLSGLFEEPVKNEEAERTSEESLQLNGERFADSFNDPYDASGSDSNDSVDYLQLHRYNGHFVDYFEALPN